MRKLLLMGLILSTSIVSAVPNRQSLPHAPFDEHQMHGMIRAGHAWFTDEVKHVIQNSRQLRNNKVTLRRVHPADLVKLVESSPACCVHVMKNNPVMNVMVQSYNNKAVNIGVLLNINAGTSAVVGHAKIKTIAKWCGAFREFGMHKTLKSTTGMDFKATTDVWINRQVLLAKYYATP